MSGKHYRNVSTQGIIPYCLSGEMLNLTTLCGQCELPTSRTLAIWTITLQVSSEDYSVKRSTHYNTKWFKIFSIFQHDHFHCSLPITHWPEAGGPLPSKLTLNTMDACGVILNTYSSYRTTECYKGCVIPVDSLGPTSVCNGHKIKCTYMVYSKVFMWCLSRACIIMANCTPLVRGINHCIKRYIFCCVGQG